MSLTSYQQVPQGISEHFIAESRTMSWDPKKIAQEAVRSLNSSTPLLELAWNLASGSVYAEQLGLEAASVILTENEDAVAKLISATAVSDEGRHSSVFAYFATYVGGAIAPPPEQIVDLSAGLLRMEQPASRMLAHTLLEGFAADEFLWFERALASAGLGEIYKVVRRDEARHVGLGLHYATKGVGSKAINRLTPEELFAAEQFVVRYSDLDAIDGLIMRLMPRLVPGQVADGCSADTRSA